MSVFGEAINARGVASPTPSVSVNDHLEFPHLLFFLGIISLTKKLSR